MAGGDLLVKVAQGAGGSLPDGFRLKGHNWERSAGEVRQTIRLRRERISYDGPSPRFSIVVDVSVAGRGVSERQLSFPSPDDPAHRFYHDEEASRWHRWIFEGADQARIDRVAGDVSDALRSHRAVIDEMFVPAYLIARSERLSVVDQLVVLAGLGQRDQVLELLEPEGWDWSAPAGSRRNTPLVRCRNIQRAAAALTAYSLLCMEATQVWIGFAEDSLRAFRGRPPKDVRRDYDRVTHLLDR